MRLWVSALISALAVSPAAASDAPRWLKIKSPNFELFTTAGERSGREVARHFEQVRSFFLDVMGLGSKSGPPVRIVVFRSDKEFAPEMRKGQRFLIHLAPFEVITLEAVPTD